MILAMNARMSAFALAITLAGLARANLVVNGGFETGNLSGWIQSGDPASSGASAGLGINGGFLQPDGEFVAWFGEHASAGGISQSIAANAGDVVSLSLWIESDGNSASLSLFSLSFDGATLPSPLVNISSPFSWRQFTYSGLLIRENDPQLAFSFGPGPNYWYLDDISVNPVPVPGAESAFLCALAAIGGIGTRRRPSTQPLCLKQ
jgi:hypothetical protein